MKRQARTECTKKLTKAIEALANCKGRDENPPKKKAVEKAQEAAACEEETIESLIAQVFQLYSNLLLEDARRPRSKILEEQVEVTPGLTYLESNTTRSKKGHGSLSWTA